MSHCSNKKKLSFIDIAFFVLTILVLSTLVGNWLLNSWIDENASETKIQKQISDILKTRGIETTMLLSTDKESALNKEVNVNNFFINFLKKEDGVNELNLGWQQANHGWQFIVDKEKGKEFYIFRKDNWNCISQEVTNYNVICVKD